MYQMPDKEEIRPINEELLQIDLPTSISGYVDGEPLEPTKEVLVEKVHEVPPDEEVDELLHWSTQLDAESIVV